MSAIDRHRADTASPSELVSRGDIRDRLFAATHRAAYLGRSYLRPFVRLRVPVASVTGAAAGSGEQRTVVVAGWKNSVAYFIHRFFSEFDRPRPVRAVPLFRLPGVLNDLRSHADMVLARVPGPGSRWLFDSSYLRLPEAVEARLAVPSDLEDLADASTRARRNIARVRNNGLSWSISRDVRDFEVFYEDYYLPFLSQRYGDIPEVIDKASLRRTFRRGCLLWVAKGKTPVSAALLEPEGPVLHYRVMGARDDVFDPVKTGALSAIYLFGAQCALEHGIRWFDLGYSKSSPYDGVLSHKGSWGARVYCPWHVDHDLVISWSRLERDIADFLHRTPLIVRDNNGLSVVTAKPPDSAGSADSIGRKAAFPGLSRIYVLGSSPGSDPEREEASTAQVVAIAGGLPGDCHLSR